MGKTIEERTYGKSIKADYKRRGLTVGIGGQVMQMRNAEKSARRKEARLQRRNAHAAAIARFNSLSISERINRLESGGNKERARASRLRSVA